MAPFETFLRQLLEKSDAAARASVRAWFGWNHGAATGEMLRALMARLPALLWEAHGAVPWGTLLARADEVAMDGQVDLLLQAAGPTHGWISNDGFRQRGLASPSLAQRRAEAAVDRLLQAPPALSVRLLERLVEQEDGTVLWLRVTEHMPLQALAQHPAGHPLLVRCAKVWLSQASRSWGLRRALEPRLDDEAVAAALMAALPQALALRFIGGVSSSLLEHLDLAGLVRSADAGPRLLTLCQGLKDRAGTCTLLTRLAARPKEGPLWGALLQVCESRCVAAAREAATQHALSVCLVPLVLHPQSEQRGRILRGLRGRDRQAALLPVAQAFAAGGVPRGAFLLQLSLIAEGCGDLLLEPRVQRFLRHRAVSHDGRKVQQLLVALGALGQGELSRERHRGLLRRILLQPDAAALAQAMEAAPSALVAAWRSAAASGTDMLTNGASKRAVDGFYAERVIPELTRQLRAYAALALSDAASPLLRQEALLPAVEMERTLCGALVDGTADALQVQTLLQGWRAPHWLYLFAGKLRSSGCWKELALLRQGVQAAATGHYVRWRRDNSEQLAQVRQHAPEVDLEAWEAGAAEPLPERAGWRLEDAAGLEDWIMGGAEGASSCQSVDGDTFYSRCMVGRIADGSKRTLVVKNDQGSVVARAMWRLLLDHAQRPVLLLGSLYDSNSLPGTPASTLLVAWARRRAAALGLPVVHKARYPRQGQPLILQAARSLTADYWDEEAGHFFSEPVTLYNVYALG